MSTEQQTNVGIGEATDQDNNQDTNRYSYMLLRRHMLYDPLSILFAVLVFIGGLIGYFVAGSKPSLIAGTIFFLLLAASTYVEGAMKNPWPLMVTLLALGSMMAYRYYDSMKLMPSGLLAILSFVMLARHAYLYYLKYQQAQQVSA